MDKVLVTGGAGYVGSVVVGKLLREGYGVRVLDHLKWGDHGLAEFRKNKNFELVSGDIRKQADLEKGLNGADHVIHLAAVVGDPACAKEPGLATEINWTASKALFDLAEKKEIKRFVFSSTCSNYGKMKDEYVDENSPLRPVSLYAELKVKFETYLLEKKIRSSICPVALRFATAYGFSPRMRFDLTVNEFTQTAVLGKDLEIYGKQFWRPYCHTEDLAQACFLALTASAEKVRQQVFNVGDTAENYTKEMLAELLHERIPSLQVKFVEKTEDPRDYRVRFEKIKRVLNFKISKTVPDGIDEIIAFIESVAFKKLDLALCSNI